MHAADDEALISKLYPQLRRFAAVVAALEDEPDDLVQEALARALAVGPLVDLDHPLAYLRRTMSNLASNRRRSLGRWRRAQARLVAGEPDHGVEPIYPSDLGLLDNLTPLDRAIIFLVDIEGLSARNAGHQLGLSENAVRLRASRSRRALQRVLAAEEAR